ncbi:MAG: Rossmann-like and DUF2520 domain-containing protein [Ramlibacter sp.]|jgi:predicted short-subunit dehydrogenase-like oxidoreductase (DUF2520 family)
MNRASEPHADLRVGFIGAGRLGKALAWSLARRGVRVVAAASQSQSAAQSLAAAIPGCVASSSQAVADRCDLVFITTPDEAIARAAAAVTWRAGMSVVHCSGVTEVAALAAAARAGAATGGFHPMQTFGDPAAAVASLPGSTITIESADEVLNATLVDLAGRLECRVNRLPPGMRARYHAAAGFTSQFINALFSQAAQVWASWGANEEDALRALMPLARGTLASIESAGIAAGMPGPVSRGDVASVDKHVQSLAGMGEEMAQFYRVMCGATIPLAQARGAIDEAVASRFRALLSPDR